MKKLTAMQTLRDFVDELVRARYGTAQALAMRIGLTLSAFSRGVSSGSLSTESLLKLALETGTAPSDLLRLAKKEHVAHLIEQLYGKGAASPLHGDMRALAEIWPTLPAAVQQALLVVLRALAKQHAASSTTRRRTA